ncbi:hypothetical protein BD769DRAFT_1677874 [Suillus cothurnatus]|nr:hypothetical protein BD769DRAFT_1677874 [Suillus cothurnatus]
MSLLPAISDQCAGQEVKEDADRESTKWTVCLRQRWFLAIVHITNSITVNLCAREWLARNKTGSAAEFKTYYDGLSDGQKKSYNKLAAKKLVNGPVSDTTLLPTSCDLNRLSALS